MGNNSSGKTLERKGTTIDIADLYKIRKSAKKKRGGRERLARMRQSAREGPKKGRKIAFPWKRTAGKMEGKEGENGGMKKRGGGSKHGTESNPWGKNSEPGDCMSATWKEEGDYL